MPAHDQTSDLANRMAGWFFVVFGLAVLFFAVAIRSTFTPETPMFVGVLIIVGVAARWSHLFGFEIMDASGDVCEFAA
jgi:hypothetical protein